MRLEVYYLGLGYWWLLQTKRDRFSSEFLGGFAVENVATASDQSTAVDGILCFLLKGKESPVLDLASAVLI